MQDRARVFTIRSISFEELSESQHLYFFPLLLMLAIPLKLPLCQCGLICCRTLQEVILVVFLVPSRGFDTACQRALDNISSVCTNVLAFEKREILVVSVKEFAVKNPRPAGAGAISMSVAWYAEVWKVFHFVCER